MMWTKEWESWHRVYWNFAKRLLRCRPDYSCLWASWPVKIFGHCFCMRCVRSLMQPVSLLELFYKTATQVLPSICYLQQNLHLFPWHQLFFRELIYLYMYIYIYIYRGYGIVLIRVLNTLNSFLISVTRVKRVSQIPSWWYAFDGYFIFSLL